MSFAADLPLFATAFLILFARVGAVLMLLPIFSEEAVPGQVRLLLAVGMIAALFGILRSRVAPLADQADVALLGTVLAELLTGLALGMLVRLFFQAAAMAASLVSLQIGLTTALVWDPSVNGQAPVLARWFALAAALICFAANIHHLWIGAIVGSYELFPVGAVPSAADWAALASATAGKAMLLAVSLAAPFMIYGVIFNVAVGFASRLAPQLQIFFIVQPLNILLGLSLLAVTAGAMLSLFAERFAEWLGGGWLHV